MAHAREQRSQVAVPPPERTSRPPSIEKDPLLILEERGPSAVDELFALVSKLDGNWERLVTCLRRMYGSPRVMELCQLLDTQHDPVLRELIYDAVAQLGRHGAPAADRLWDRLRSEPARRALLRCMSRIEPEGVPSRLLQLREDDPRLFAEAVEQLRSGGSETEA